MNNENKEFKNSGLINNMSISSFYLYKLKLNGNPPDFKNRFSSDKLIENIAEVQISEDEKKRYLLVISKKEGNYLYGCFYKLREDFRIDILDKTSGQIAIAQLDKTQAWIEKSRFIYDGTRNLLLGEYNDAGVRFFQMPLREYLKKLLNMENLEIEIVYNRDSYMNIEQKNIKYIKIKVAKPKLSILENVFGLSNIDILNEAIDSDDKSFFIELKMSAGYKKNIDRSFFSKLMKRINEITDPKGIKKIEIREVGSDTSLELIKDRVLKTKINIENLRDEDIFRNLVNVYEDLNIDEILEVSEDEND